MAKRKTNEQFLSELAQVNPNISVLEEYVNNRHRLLVQCKVCGRKWKAIPLSLLQGNGCRDCRYKEQSIRQTKSNEQFLRELKETNACIVALEEYQGALTPIMFHCTKCGHKWKARPTQIVHAYTSCPKCSNHLQRTTKSFIEELEKVNPDIEVLGEYESNTKPILVRCLNCNEEWHARPKSLLRGAGCPSCNHTPTSFIEQFIYYVFVEAIGQNSVISRDNKTIGFELDIFIPSRSFAVEIGAWYWHRNRLENDKRKKERCRDKGIRLVTIYDSVPGGTTCPFDDDCLLFSQDLKMEKNHETLRNLSLSLLKEVGEEVKTDDIDWRKIESLALLHSRKLNTAEFAAILFEKNPDIEMLGEYKGALEKALVRCKRCDYKWETRPAGLMYGYGCPVCASKRTGAALRKTNEEFQKEVASKYPDIEVRGEYITSKDNLTFSCKKCGYVWSASPNRLLRSKGCPKCAIANRALKQRKEHDDFISELKKVDPTISVLEEYKGADTKIRVRCSSCGREWLVRPASLLRGVGCGKCKRSRAAEKRTKTDQQFREELLEKQPMLEVLEAYKGCREKLLFRCKVCGHTWRQAPYKALQGKGCARCRG